MGCKIRLCSHALSMMFKMPPLPQTAAPQTCGFLSRNFGTKYFDYNAGWSSSSYVPDGCTLE